jgi:hypothetical protein
MSADRRARKRSEGLGSGREGHAEAARAQTGSTEPFVRHDLDEVVAATIWDGAAP